MNPQQSLTSLRQIAGKVDALIETLTSGGQNGPAPDAPANATPQTVSLGATPGAGAVLEALHPVLLATTPGEVFDRTVEAVAVALGCERAILMLLEEGNKLRFKAGRGIDQQALGGAEFGRSRDLIKRVLQEGAATSIGAAELAGTGLAGVACAPIMVVNEGRRAIGGALYVDSTRAPIGDPELKTLAVLVDAAAARLQNMRSLASAEESTSRFFGATQKVERLRTNISRLYDVGRSINSTLILDELLVVIVDHVLEVSRAQRGCLLLFEGRGDERRLVYKVGRNARHEFISEAEFAYSTTVVEQTVADKQSTIMTDTVGEADLSLSMVQMELKSIMCAPLKEQDRVMGVVYVDSQQSNHEFDPSDQDIVESLCGQASVAITNARLYARAKERERIRHELNIAARLQRDLLPNVIPRVKGLDMFGALTPALEIGGDYYDFIPHEGTQDSLTIAIGDVSGKGVGAGLVMAMARSGLRSLIEHKGVPSSPLPIVKSLNVMLCRGTPPNMFMTFNVLIWDGNTNTLRYAPAGHEHLLVFRQASGEVEVLRAGGVAGGVLEEASELLVEHELRLDAGDHVVLYTDGVTECMNQDQQGFGLQATVDLVRAHGASSPKELCGLIEQALHAHRGRARMHDDITLVSLKAR
ncbi:MAG: SpoIIE family protein phosphatase [Planctomycetes bacterium]|nr:SpoIIE family protein phosphatase [Planctomycetota bacterium]